MGIPDAGIPTVSPFQKVLLNRSDGASALLEQFIQLAEQQDPDVVASGLIDCQRTFPLMAIWSFALDQLKVSDQGLPGVGRLMAQQTRETIENAASRLQEFKTVLTLSNSSIVRRAILRVNTALEVFCGESLPGGEGHQLTELLTTRGIQAQLIDDEMIPIKIPHVDAILLGADQYDDLGFINKIGSLELSLHARRKGKPLFVLAEEFKRVAQLPTLTPELATLEFELMGQSTRVIVFEKVKWEPHIRLVSNTGVPSE